MSFNDRVSFYCMGLLLKVCLGLCRNRGVCNRAAESADPWPLPLSCGDDAQLSQPWDDRWVIYVIYKAQSHLL